MIFKNITPDKFVVTTDAGPDNKNEPRSTHRIIRPGQKLDFTRGAIASASKDERLEMLIKVKEKEPEIEEDPVGEEISDEVLEEVMEEEPIKRKRGRPKKNN